jgi:hypothetical protein
MRRLKIRSSGLSEISVEYLVVDSIYALKVIFRLTLEELRETLKSEFIL